MQRKLEPIAGAATQEMIDAALEKRPFDGIARPNPSMSGRDYDQLRHGAGKVATWNPREAGDPEGVPHDVAVRLGLSH